MTVDDIIEDVIRREFGFVNNPVDPGGPTKNGITLLTLSRWLGHAATIDELMNLTADDTRRIYRELYVEDPHFDRIADQQLLAFIVDAGVQHGTGTVTRWLQKACGLADDGIFGANTTDAVNAKDPRELRKLIVSQRAITYGRLIANDPKQATFAAGWLNRLAEFIRAL